MLSGMHCPRCARPLESTGTADVNGAPWPVYQCDHCVVDVVILGYPVEASLTFAVSPAGELFDPQTLAPLDPARN